MNFELLNICLLTLYFVCLVHVFFLNFISDFLISDFHFERRKLFYLIFSSQLLLQTVDKQVDDVDGDDADDDDDDDVDDHRLW